MSEQECTGVIQNSPLRSFFLDAIVPVYLIFTFREFKSIHKGKTAILHLCFGTEKNRRLGSKKARYIRAFRRRHLFCLHIMAFPR